MSMIAVEEILRSIVGGLIFCCCVFVANLILRAFCGGNDG